MAHSSKVHYSPITGIGDFTCKRFSENLTKISYTCNLRKSITIIFNEFSDIRDDIFTYMRFLSIAEGGK